jgi:hypothetical protein
MNVEPADEQTLDRRENRDRSSEADDVQVEHDQRGSTVRAPGEAAEIRLDTRTVRHHGTLSETGLDTDPLH